MEVYGKALAARVNSAGKRRLQHRVAEDGIALRSCLVEVRVVDGGSHLGWLAKLTVMEVHGEALMLTGKLSLSQRCANRFLPDAHLVVFASFARSLPRRRGPRPLSPTGRPRQCRGAPARQLAWRGRGVLFAGRWTRVGMRVKAWGCECTMRSYLAISSSKLNLSNRVLLQCHAQRSNQQKR